MIKFLLTIFMFLIIFPYGYSITVFAQLQNNSLPPTVSDKMGTFSIDKSEYDISVTKRESVKTYGVVYNPQNAGRVDISITLPDKTINGYLIFINATNGYFENQYQLDSSSQIGTYHVLATYNGEVIGTLDFTVKKVLLQQTPITNTTIIIHNQTNVKTLTNNTTPASHPKTISYIDTRLSLDYKESVNKGYVGVYTTLTTNSGSLQSSEISILVDGQFKTYVSTEVWSSDIFIGFGSHTIQATYPLTSDLKDSSIIYKNSDAFKTIAIQQPPTSPPPIPSSGVDVTITQGAGASANADCVAANNCFSPNPLLIKAPGTTVTWTNTDTVSHTITSGKPSDNNAGSMFDSGLVKPGKTFQFTFVNTGRYDYFCTVHPWMEGQVIVGGPVIPSPNPLPTISPSPPVSNTPPQKQPIPTPVPTHTPTPSTVPNTSQISNTFTTPDYIYVVLVIVGVIVSVIVLVILRKRKTTVTPTTRTDDTQFYGCPNCGGDIVTKKGKQFCNRCNQYL